MASLHLLAIMDKLVKQSASSKLPKAPLYGCRSNFEAIGFFLPTKKLQDYRQQIEKYFVQDDEHPEKLLFSFATKARWQIEARAYGLRYATVDDQGYLDKQYIDTCLADPLVQKKLHQKEITDPAAQIRELVTDTKEYLPEVDGLLKQSWLNMQDLRSGLYPLQGSQSALVNLLLRLRNLPGPANWDFDEGRSEFYWQEKYREINQEQLLVSGEKNALWARPNKTSGGRAASLAWELSNLHAEYQEYMTKEREVVNRNLKLKPKKKEANRVVVQDHSTNELLSKEDTLHVRLTNVDTLDAPWRVLTFLEDRFPDSFQEEGIQELLLVYLYHPATAQVLQEQPLFVKKLIAQCLRAYYHYKEEGALETAAFMVQYLKRLEGVYEEHVGTKTPFAGIRYRTMLEKELLPLAKKKEGQKAIYGAIALLHYQAACRGIK